jgi:hypothetical protein
MKTKILFLATALFFTTYLFSQTTFGLRGGVNFSSLNSKDNDGHKDETKMLTGFNLGVNAEIPVGVDFYIQPGLLFTTKGGEYKDVSPATKVNISYIEIPVNVIYKPSLGKGKVLLGFGPYVAFGVGGRFKVGDAKTDIHFTNEVTQDDEPGIYFKRMDAGANFLAGYEWANRFSAQLNAGLGLVNIRSEVAGQDDGDASVKNTGFGISLGYRFGK